MFIVRPVAQEGFFFGGGGALARSPAAHVVQVSPSGFDIIINVVVLLAVWFLVSPLALGMCPCPAFAHKRRGSSNRCDNPDFLGLSELE